MLLGPELAHLQTAIVELDRFGGTCLNRGCIPTKMFVVAADAAVGVEAASRLGVHASVEAIDWKAIRDRVFGRIDPLHQRAVDYRRDSGGGRLHRRRAVRRAEGDRGRVRVRRRDDHRGDDRGGERHAPGGAGDRRAVRRRLPHIRHDHAHRRGAGVADRHRRRGDSGRDGAHLRRARRAGHHGAAGSALAHGRGRAGRAALHRARPAAPPRAPGHPHAVGAAPAGWCSGDRGRWGRVGRGRGTGRRLPAGGDRSAAELRPARRRGGGPRARVS